MNYRLKSRLDRTSPLLECHIARLRDRYDVEPVIGIGRIDSALLASRGVMRRQVREDGSEGGILDEQYIAFYNDGIRDRALWLAQDSYLNGHLRHEGNDIYNSLNDFPEVLRGLQAVALFSRFHEIAKVAGFADSLNLHWLKVYVALPKTGRQAPDRLVREMVMVDEILKDAFPEEAPRMSQRQGSGAPSSS